MNDASRRTERSAQTGFATSSLDRRADLRDKPDEIATLRARSDARFTVIAGETPILLRTGAETQTVWFDESGADGLGPAQEEVFLGLDPEGAPRFGRLIERDQLDGLREQAVLVVTDLRSVALKRLVPKDELGPLGEAKALLD